MFGQFARRLCAATFACLAAASSARAEIIPLSDLVHGTQVSAAQCARVRETVYVTAYGEGFCMRYYLSNAGGEGRWPVVFLQGDRLGRYSRKTQTWSQPGTSNLDTTEFIRNAEILSREARTTGIYLARMGVDGSSGFHGDRKTNLELYVTNAALEAIKQRYHFAGFHLVGQSGGSMVIGGLLTLRKDIGCAVPGSARDTLDAHDAPASASPAAQPIDNSADVPMIALNRTARILVVTDPRDKRAQSQIDFARALRQAGHPVDQFFVQAIDAEHHGVARYSYLAVSACVQGMDSREISLRLDALVQKSVARAEAEGPRLR
jgi:hypothetical protein